MGEVNNVDVPAMVRAAGSVHMEHAQQALDTIVDCWMPMNMSQCKWMARYHLPLGSGG